MDTLFVITFVCSFMFILIAISVICGNKLDVSPPILYMIGVSYGNAYIVTPSLLFQVWWWSTHFNLIGGI